MYSLFLLTSPLSFLALLVRGRARRARPLGALGRSPRCRRSRAHPYGALVLASQAVFVSRARGRGGGSLRLAIVVARGIPFWRTDLVLAGRFEVGRRWRRRALGSPLDVLRYLGRRRGRLHRRLPAGARRRPRCSRRSAACALSRPAAERAPRRLRRRSRPSLLLAAGAVRPAASPESRHLIFVLPFFLCARRRGLVAARRKLGRAATPARRRCCLVGRARLGLARTPSSIAGEPAARIGPRAASAAAWLAETSRHDDVLFGYDPLFLEAWERERRLPARSCPRADSKLALAELRSARARSDEASGCSTRATRATPSAVARPIALPTPRRAPSRARRSGRSWSCERSSRRGRPLVPHACAESPARRARRS